MAPWNGNQERSVILANSLQLAYHHFDFATNFAAITETIELREKKNYGKNNLSSM